jgi:hypothetical protein
MCSLVSLHCDADMALPLVLIGTCACLTAVAPRHARVVSTVMRTCDRFSVIRVRTQELSRLWEMSLSFLLGVLLPSRARNDFTPPFMCVDFESCGGHSCRQVGATTLQCTATLLQHHLWYTSTYVGHPLTTLDGVVHSTVVLYRDTPGGDHKMKSTLCFCLKIVLRCAGTLRFTMAQLCLYP